ncbi:NAD(P)-dependent oxidoreductase [Polynucleobacter kasalickyi]|uniref:3-hydroxyisobutyrate dehydrogenase n=1 Tax=Polynucleobacter kasalickyi TaxID=1938817 RepID=A0A1W1Y3F9_9BURK|nr:NAD(P)-dependent oxidoreductase [Polynucleobacter kasalickyi]SMC30654.1 3-hydroxyisobutyrate dehydrogenase [Polynucleobacter kasalickyi]
MSTPLSNHVGVIGLGLMGNALVKRLDSAGVQLLGYDVDLNRCKEFGADRIRTIPGLGTACRVIFLAVFNTAQVEATLLGADGLLKDQPKEPITVICTSTCDPDEIKRIAKAFTDLGHHFLELPISGTSLQLARGDALGLMGGDETQFSQVSALLDIVTPKRQHIGEVGDAGKAKLAINLVLGLHRASMAEGLVFGQQLGLDPAKLLATLQLSAAASSVMGVKGSLMVQRQYQNPQSKVDQSLKDFHLIWDLAQAKDQHLPLAQRYIELLETELAQGNGHLDNAIIFEAILKNSLVKPQ